MDNILHYKNYSGSVEYSLFDSVYYGKILNITDLVNYESVSVEELKIAFKEAVEDYIDMCKLIGK